MARLEHALLRIRDAPLLQRMCLERLAQRNIAADEIVAHDLDDGHPGITLNTGVHLSAPDDLRIGRIRACGLPESHNGCLAAYLLRYRFGHAFPEFVIDTAPIPRHLFPSVIHRQHLNTLLDLPEPARSEFLEAIPVREGDRVLEIGPYIGFGTTRLSAAVGDQGSVLSIEADREAYALLQHNIARNGLRNVRTRSFAVSGEDCSSANFYRTGRQANSLHQEVVAGAEFEPVEVRSLGGILGELESTPTFIILTINGSELAALESARDILGAASGLRLVVPGWYRDPQGRLGERIRDLLRALDFHVAVTRGLQVFAYKD